MKDFLEVYEKNRVDYDEVFDVVDEDFDIDRERAQDHMVKLVNEMLEGLTEREKNILTMRYGLNGREDFTLKSVGDIIGVSRSRVREIEAKAIRTLRRNDVFHCLKGVTSFTDRLEFK